MTNKKTSHRAAGGTTATTTASDNWLDQLTCLLAKHGGRLGIAAADAAAMTLEECWGLYRRLTALRFAEAA